MKYRSRFASTSLSEFLWLFVSLQEKLSLLLLIVTEKLRIEISRVKGTSIVSPFFNIGIVKWSHNLLIVMLFFPLLKLFRHWCVRSSLELLNLISIKAVIVKNLPLLWLTLISCNRTFNSSFLTNNFFDPVLQFNKHLLNSSIVFSTCNTSVCPHELSLIVIVIEVHLTWGNIISNNSHVFLLGFEGLH
jgi:hypothetical protein